ncbi:hypothetical protein ACFX2A_015239 [Malus domestica]
MLPLVTQVIAQTDVIRYMLTRLIIKGRIGKWTMALSEFSLQYVPQKAVKGQALADFLAQHPSIHGFGGTDVEINMVKRAITIGRCTLTVQVLHPRLASELSFNPQTTIVGIFRSSWILNAQIIRLNRKPLLSALASFMTCGQPMPSSSATLNS